MLGFVVVAGIVIAAVFVGLMILGSYEVDSENRYAKKVKEDIEDYKRKNGIVDKPYQEKEKIQNHKKEEHEEKPTYNDNSSYSDTYISYADNEFLAGEEAYNRGDYEEARRHFQNAGSSNMKTEDGDNVFEMRRKCEEENDEFKY